jgi:hypothetical protein
MVTATAACFVAFGASPTAATTSTYIAANTPYLFRVNGAGRTQRNYPILNQNVFFSARNV